MKQYGWGLFTGGLLAFSLTIVTAAAPPQDDSIKVYLSQLEEFLGEKCQKVLQLVVFSFNLSV